jgi:hypothetical protein
MAKAEDLTRGTQIVYRPNHAEDLSHHDCEEGFIASVDPDANVAWCRYWYRDYDELRTKSCSERTPIANIVIKDTHAQARVQAALVRIGETMCQGCKRDCRTAWPACEKVRG